MFRAAPLLALPPLLAACATVAAVAGQSWTTALVGNQVVPGPGAADATGTAKLTADPTLGTICIDLSVQALDRAAVTHLHRARRGASGPVVLVLSPPVGGRSKECLQVENALANAVIADPAGYYVDVHTAAHPNGAIRGQLAGR